MSAATPTVRPYGASGVARAGRRAGYLASIVVAGVLAFVANRVIGEAWPPLLTPAFADLLPYINASLAATAVVNAVWLVRDPSWLRHLAQIGLNAIAMVVAVRTWQIFPFDTDGLDPLFEQIARGLIAVGVVALAAATAAEAVRLVVGRDEP